jgi:hypothetical protein
MVQISKSFYGFFVSALYNHHDTLDGLVSLSYNVTTVTVLES